MSNTNTRGTRVQTPGGSNDTGEGEGNKPASTGAEAGTGTSATGPDMAEIQARVAELLENQKKLEAENAKLRKTKGEVAPKLSGTSATSHAHLPASEIDPKSIASPVLSRDGWVIPDDSDKPARK